MGRSEPRQTGASNTHPEAGQPARLRRTADQRQEIARRSRVARTISILVLGALCLILLAALRRDSNSRQDAINSVQARIEQFIVDEEQARWPEGLVKVVATSALPQLPQDEPVVIAYSNEIVRLPLLPDGRAVVVQIGSAMRADWMTHKQLTARLQSQSKLLTEKSLTAPELD
jgi:hypothetical protein